MTCISNHFKPSPFSPAHAFSMKVGDREDSSVYIRMKMKAGEQIGIRVTHVKLPRWSTQFDVVSAIQRLNRYACVCNGSIYISAQILGVFNDVGLP